MNNDKYFLYHNFRYIGLILVAIGTIVGIIYTSFDLRINIPDLAFLSIYMEKKFFTVINTNVAEELILLCLLIDFFFIVFSREKSEQLQAENIRTKALFRALFWNTILICAVPYCSCTDKLLW